MSNDLNSSSQTFSKNMGLRLIAYIIDSAITVGILMINYITLSIVSSISPNPEKLGEIGVAIISASIILTFITGFGYYFFRDAFKKGSLGKRIFKLHVVKSKDYSQCNLLQSFVRNLTLMILSFDFLIPLLNKYGKRIGDFFAGTVVVKERQ